MKLFKKVLLTSALMLTSAANADVVVEFAPDVESIIVNGEKTFNLLESTKSVTLKDGLNQVVVRVSKLAEGQGQLEKYRSVPLVVTFTAADQTLLIKPSMRVLNAIDVSNYDENPSMHVVAKNGQRVDAKVERLPQDKTIDSSSFFSRNYVKELEQYNAAQGYALVSNTAQAVETVKAVSKVQPIKTAKVLQEITSSEADLKQLYLQLSAEQRKSFLGWAVTQ